MNEYHSKRVNGNFDESWPIRCDDVHANPREPVIHDDRLMYPNFQIFSAPFFI